MLEPRTRRFTFYKKSTELGGKIGSAKNRRDTDENFEHGSSNTCGKLRDRLRTKLLLVLLVSYWSYQLKSLNKPAGPQPKLEGKKLPFSFLPISLSAHPPSFIPTFLLLSSSFSPSHLSPYASLCPSPPLSSSLSLEENSVPIVACNFGGRNFPSNKTCYNFLSVLPYLHGDTLEEGAKCFFHHVFPVKGFFTSRRM